MNRTEPALRVTHVPTGIQAIAAEERSPHRNWQLAMARLVAKLAGKEDLERSEAAARRWKAHHELERGNPMRVLRAESLAEAGVTRPPREFT